METCQDCKHKQGDGHPYGDITCTIDGKMKHETRQCDVKRFLENKVCEHSWKPFDYYYGFEKSTVIACFKCLKTPAETNLSETILTQKNVLAARCKIIDRLEAELNTKR